MDACEPVGEDGSFGTMPMRKLDARGEPIPNTTYTLLPGVVTRGREPAPGELEREAAAAAAGPTPSDILNAMLAEAGVAPGSAMAGFAASMTTCRRPGSRSEPKPPLAVEAGRWEC